MEKQNKNFFTAVGLMSGTSCDGLDICYCHFELEFEKWRYNIIEAKTIPYVKEWERKLRNADSLNGRDLILLHKEFGIFCGNEVNKFLTSFNLAKPDFISSHGHTIFHEPDLGLNFQIGDGNCISAICGCKTIFDFRSLDIAFGGQGAPLVPIGDKLLFNQYDACLNLGGIANVSFEFEGKRIAFDICPFNLLVNHFAKREGLAFDNDGILASEGIVCEKLLYELNNLPFVNHPFPKSLGIERIESEYMSILNNLPLSAKDVLATLTEHVVIQVDKVLRNSKLNFLLITGGGAYNVFFIEKLKNRINISVIVPDAQLIEFKEALIFAFLGCLRFVEADNTLLSVTGAAQNCSSGLIAM